MAELPGKVPANGEFDRRLVDEANAGELAEGARCAKSHSICLRAQLEHCGGRSSHWSRARQQWFWFKQCVDGREAERKYDTLMRRTLHWVQPFLDFVCDRRAPITSRLVSSHGSRRDGKETERGEGEKKMGRTRRRWRLPGP